MLETQVAPRKIDYNEFDRVNPEHSSAKIYQDFYSTYAPDQFPHTLETNGREYPELLVNYPELLVSRVLHIDRADGGDRSMHLIVRSAGDKRPEWTHTNSPGGYSSTRPSDQPERHKINHYNPDALVVATTDGKEIIEWTIDGVFGYNAPFAKSGLHLEAQVVVGLIRTVDDSGRTERARLVLNKGFDSGYMQGRETGWVLGRESSDMERSLAGAIPSAQEIVEQECSEAVERMLAESALRAASIDHILHYSKT